MTLEQEREVQVAVVAAEDALDHLELAREQLGSARSWGRFDLIAGGFLSTMVKHGKMEQARQELQEAKRALQVFSTELRELDSMQGIDLNTGDFLAVADYIFDGLFADWMMQSRIRTAQEQVDEAIRQVRRMRQDLQAILTEGGYGE